MKSMIDGIKHKLCKNTYAKLSRFVSDFQLNNNILLTSTNLLQFHVEDILGLAQIRSNKFPKNEQRFNLKNAVEEIRTIQHHSAQQKMIEIKH